MTCSSLKAKMGDSAQMFSVDLKKAALYELEFLEHVKSLKLLQDFQVLQVALHRYEKHWLPFLQSYSQVTVNSTICLAHR